MSAVKITPIDLNKSGKALQQQIQTQKGINRTLTLNQIQIKNIDEWNEAKSKDFVSNVREGSKDYTNPETPVEAH